MNVLDGILGFLVLIIVGTSVLIPTVKSANTTGWTTAEIALFGLVTIFIIVGFIRFAGNFAS